MKTVLLISHSSDWGGGELVFTQILDIIKSSGVKVIIILPKKEGKLYEKLKNEKHEIINFYNLDCVKDYKFVLKIFLNMKAVLKILKLLIKYDIDLIYTNSSVNIVGVVASLILKKRHIWHIHEFMLTTKLQEMIYKKLLSYSRNELIFVSRKNFNVWKNSLNSDLKNSKILYNPCRIIEKHPKKSSNFSFGFAGSQNPNKNLEYLLEAFKVLNENYPELELVIAGQEKLPKKIELEGNRNIIMLGQVEKIEIFFELIDVLVVPSKKESFSLIAMEAMSLGIPIITNENVGIAEILENEKTALIYSVYDNGDLYVQMEKIYLNKNLYKKIQDNSGVIFSKLFSNKEFEKNIKSILNKV